MGGLLHPPNAPPWVSTDIAQAQALLIMLAGLILARMTPSGYITLCTFTYAMLVVMYLHRCGHCLRPCNKKGRT